MKTRIISGIVAGAIVLAVLILNIFTPLVSVLAISFLSVLAMGEMLYKTGAVKQKSVVISAAAYTVLFQLSAWGILPLNHEVITLLYVLLVVAFALKYFSEFGPLQIGMSIAMPIALSYAFASITSLINARYGLFYLALVFNFACVSDICAYFVGSAIGKRKLAPEISPKKTVEGLIGGLVGSVIGTLIISVIFNLISGQSANILVLMVITPIMSVIGVVGDLFASVIKRHFNIKDYGNIMPGHGGVLDRLDSMLLIAPSFLFFLTLLEVVS